MSQTAIQIRRSTSVFIPKYGISSLDRSPFEALSQLDALADTPHIVSRSGKCRILARRADDSTVRDTYYPPEQVFISSLQLFS
jgi:hypothetical protein